MAAYMLCTCVCTRAIKDLQLGHDTVDTVNHLHIAAVQGPEAGRTGCCATQYIDLLQHRHALAQRALLAIQHWLGQALQQVAQATLLLTNDRSADDGHLC